MGGLWLRAGGCGPLACDGGGEFADGGQNRMPNVPVERAGRERGMFATWDAINVPR